MGGFLYVSFAYSVPPGFEHLAQERDEVVEVKLAERYIGDEQIRVSSEGFTFLNPSALALKLMSGIHDDDIHEFESAFEGLHPLINERSCVLNPTLCDLDTQSVLFLYDEGAGVVKLLVNQKFMKKTDQQRYYEVDQKHKNAWLQSIRVSGTQNFNGDFSGTIINNSVIGVGDKGHAVFGMNVRTKTERSSDTFNIDTAYYRYDINHRWYAKGGKLSLSSIGMASEGGFNYQLLPRSTVYGVQLGSGTHYFNRSQAHSAQTLEVLSIAGGKADLYIDGLFVHSQNLMSGYNQINKSRLPSGNYPLEIKIYEGNQLSRIENHMIQSINRISDGHPQWLMKVGAIEKTNTPILEMATWFPTEHILPYINDVSLSVQATDERFLAEAGLSASGLLSMGDKFLIWNADGQILSGYADDSHVLSSALVSNLSFDRHSLFFNWRNTASDGCVDSNEFSCSRSARFGVASSFLNTVFRLSYSVNNRYFNDPFRDDYSSNVTSLSVSKNLSISNLNLSISGTLSETRTSFLNDEKNVFINLSVSKKSGNNFYYTRVNHSNHDDYSLASGFSYSKDNVNKFDANVEQSSRGVTSLNGSAFKDMNEVGQIGASVYSSHTGSKHNQSLYLGYSIGFMVDEDMNFSLGPPNVFDQSSAIIIKSDNGERIPYSLEGLSSLRDGVYPITDRVMYPTSGYNNLSYVLNDGNNDRGEGVTELTSGLGRRSVYLSPGRIYEHVIKSNTKYYYLGSLNDINVKEILTPGVVLLEADQYGDFIIQSDKKIKSIIFGDNDSVINCQFDDVSASGNIINIGSIVCETTH
ncbi:TcfC E-set like domain-containing protein [Vibrio metschnikovii]|uniref:TcfC E-set like domain-containing protein n=1 Tax=Vibrio metschnikovii TaxID=28172 RepID=UPI00164B3230|nr:TcfC E-set like domain-containing protein [Vibrio metschnikovii]MBC5830885.1 TcfC E-set like domain-containing protein [Vibrio metschnikovii]